MRRFTNWLLWTVLYLAAVGMLVAAAILPLRFVAPALALESSVLTEEIEIVIDGSRNGCHEPYCGSGRTLRGLFVVEPPVRRPFQVVNPLKYSVFTRGTECVRIEILERDDVFDPFITAVLPDNTVIQDDDSAGNLNPLIITRTNAPEDQAGFVTVVVQAFANAAPVGNHEYDIRFDRYELWSDNCRVGGSLPPPPPPPYYDLIR